MSTQRLSFGSVHPERLMCRTLRAHPKGQAVARILAAALDAVNPSTAISRFMQRSGDTLTIGSQQYDLAQFRHIYLVGFGKAAAPMGQTAAEVLSDRLDSGLLVTKDGHGRLPDSGFDSRLEVLEAGHPVPDQRGLQASMRIRSSLQNLTAEDLVVCLVSGGGSALLTAPIEGIPLEDLMTLTANLLACGATIFEINTLRKHLEQLKGGLLARVAAPASLATLVLSDVIGDPFDVIASGPTVPDPSTFEDSVRILERYSLTAQTPNSILDHLARGVRGEIADTPKPGDPAFDRVNNQIVANNRQAAQSAIRQARIEGIQTHLLTAFLQGEARQAGRFSAALARELELGGVVSTRPACLILGGETTVTLRGDGLGGRNQELALGAVTEFAGLPTALLVTLATDGGDGPTDAAGAVVNGETLSRARSLGLSPNDFLNRSDSYHFFSTLDDLIRPGPTLTNVNDLSFIFSF